MGSYYDKLWAKKQKDTNLNVNTNTINVNVDCCDHKKDKHEDKHEEKCCDHKKDEKKENVRSSAFRALKTAAQTVPANTVVQVMYPNEQYDIANEYNAATSTFIPATRGIYSIIASVAFAPNNTVNPYRVLLTIRVNGVDVAADNDFFSTIFFSNVITVATDIQLNAGDAVQVFFASSVAGQIVTENLNAAASHFEAARFPSPAN